MASAASRPGRAEVLGHLVLVLLLTVPYVLLTLEGRTGSSSVPIGLAVLSLPLLFPLGLPWSAAYLYDPDAFTSDLTRSLAVLGPAYLNVLLHALWRRYGKQAGDRRGRSARRE